MSPFVVMMGLLLAPAILALGILFCAGVAFLVGYWHTRHPAPDVAFHLWSSYDTSSVGDEAEAWLKTQV